MTTNIIVIHFSTRTELNSPHKCNTTAIQLQYKNSCIAVVLHLCGPLQYNAAIQVFYNLQKTCTLLAAVVKKTCIAVVLRLCGLLQYRKIFVLCYCSCIVVVLHLYGLLYKQCCFYEQKLTQLESSRYSALPSLPQRLKWRTHTQRDRRRATQYLLRSLIDGEGKNVHYQRKIMLFRTKTEEKHE